MKNNIPYIRVKTDYYKLVEEPSIDGTKKRVMLDWKKDTIKDDHGKEFLNKIPKYEDFVNYPEHIKYKQEIDGFYNKYNPINHQLKKGHFPTTETFLKQVFQEQYLLAIDYFSIIWQHPIHILPILCLISSARQTGKTTFLNWLKDIFQNNMTINTSDDFESSFNSDWADKLIIGVEEAKFEKKNIINLIKNNSTAKNGKLHGKNKNKKEIETFNKFVMTSNHVDNFIEIDRQEIRFWIRELNPFSVKIENLESKLKEEIPYFLWYIQNRKIKTSRTSRMWFSNENIRTEALDRISNKTAINAENELINILIEQIQDLELTEIKYTKTEIKELVQAHYRNIKLTDIRNILEIKWKLKASLSTSYKGYQKIYNEYSKAYEIVEHPKKGRVYIFTLDFLNEKLC